MTRSQTPVIPPPPPTYQITSTGSGRPVASIMTHSVSAGSAQNPPVRPLDMPSVPRGAYPRGRPSGDTSSRAEASRREAARREAARVLSAGQRVSMVHVHHSTTPLTPIAAYPGRPRHAGGWLQNAAANIHAAAPTQRRLLTAADASDSMFRHVRSLSPGHESAAAAAAAQPAPIDPAAVRYSGDQHLRYTAGRQRLLAVPAGHGGFMASIARPLYLPPVYAAAPAAAAQNSAIGLPFAATAAERISHARPSHGPPPIGPPAAPASTFTLRQLASSTFTSPRSAYSSSSSAAALPQQGQVTRSATAPAPAPAPWVAGAQHLSGPSRAHPPSIPPAQPAAAHPVQLHLAPFAIEPHDHILAAAAASAHSAYSASSTRIPVSVAPAAGPAALISQSPSTSPRVSPHQGPSPLPGPIPRPSMSTAELLARRDQYLIHEQQQFRTRSPVGEAHPLMPWDHVAEAIGDDGLLMSPAGAKGPGP